MRVTAVTGSQKSAIGAPIATHRLLDHLRDVGHEVTATRNTNSSTFSGVDVAILSGGGLEGPVRAAKAAGARVVVLVHSRLRPQIMDLADLVVWNTAAARGDRPGIVCHPVTWPEDYATTPGDRVTLVNLAESKGGELFGRLVKAMPDTQFLGVSGGYGRQMRPTGANVDVIATTANMRDDVYARTRMLLMPSASESWGMVGVEAMASGIPVIAHPTPGLRESLGDAGIFVDRDDVHGWIAAINNLNDETNWALASDAARARSAEIDPQRSLDVFTAAVEKLGPPVKPMTPPRVAVIGTGRSGTGYMSKLLGFGHEAWWNPNGRRQSNLPGDVSWLALPSVEAGEHDGPVLHVTRHPVDVVRSLAGIGFFAGTDQRDPDSVFRSFAVTHCPEADLADPVEAAVEWWCRWNERCAEVADFTVRLEDITAQDEDTVAAVAEITGVPVEDWAEPPPNTNSRPHSRKRTTAARIWKLLDGRAARFSYESD